MFVHPLLCLGTLLCLWLGCTSAIFYRKGCELINQQAKEGECLENMDTILDIMDMDNNDSIDINEFFEVTFFLFMMLLRLRLTLGDAAPGACYAYAAAASDVL